jgi:hypothetical protein
VTCAVCGRLPTVSADPPRRTIARGPDPDDPSFTVTVVLPDVELCQDHYLALGSKNLFIGWCDDEQCRIFGEVEELSPCGKPFVKLRR